MTLLIDGYNLLHATGLEGRGVGPGTLERSRGALLNFLATALEERQRSQTIVVFDAKNAPPGLPRKLQYKGLTVLYAAGYEDADTLLEELIQEDSAPRRMVVVSSDHRVQRAARRRRATAVDSGPWYADLARQLRSGQRKVAPADAKPAAPLSPEEVRWWMSQFGAVSEEEIVEQETESSSSVSPTDDQHTAERPIEEQCEEIEKDYEDIGNPFPPGYGEDLLSGEE